MVARYVNCHSSYPNPCRCCLGSDMARRSSGMPLNSAFNQNGGLMTAVSLRFPGGVDSRTPCEYLNLKVLKSLYKTVWSDSCSVVSDSLWPRGLYSPWNSPGQNTGVGSLSLLQGIFPTQGSNPGLPHCRWLLYQLRYQGYIICGAQYKMKLHDPLFKNEEFQDGESRALDHIQSSTCVSVKSALSMGTCLFTFSWGK